MNKHAIEVSFIAATNTRGSRVKLVSGRFSDDKTDAVTIGFDHGNYTLDNAVNWLVANGYTVFCTADSSKGYIVMVNEFISLADAKAGKRWNNGLVA